MMRQPLIRKAKPGLQVSQTTSIPAPIGGWNTRDPESAMKETDALRLENWWPGTADVTVRKGATYHATDFPTPVQSLLSYSAPGVKELFATTSTGLYDATVAGAVGASLLTLTSGWLQHVNITVAGGSYLMAVNGADRLMRYDGASWTFVDNLTAVAPITGIATTEFSNICLFKRRLFFIEKNSMSAWYLPVASIGGAAVELPLGELFSEGGQLLAMAGWTIDGGNGSDDFAAFITTEGQLAIYKGTDPATAADWVLVGVYELGEPVGPKCFVKFGGDVLVLTQTGLTPLSSLYQSATLNREASVSNKIDSAFSAAAAAYRGLKGWEGSVLSKENLLLINIPTVEGSAATQFCMNTITKAWCRFTGWEALCWEVCDQDMYFGGSTFVAKALTGYADFDTNIVARAKPAFTYFRQRARTKHIKLVRPMLKVDGSISVLLGINVDFEDVNPSGAITFGPAISSIWDSSEWDAALWSSEYSAQREWRSVDTKEGYCAALLLQIATKSIRVGWSSTDFAYQLGGVL
jgi:hypothetical protein